MASGKKLINDPNGKLLVRCSSAQHPESKLPASFPVACSRRQSVHAVLIRSRAASWCSSSMIHRNLVGGRNTFCITKHYFSIVNGTSEQQNQLVYLFVSNFQRLGLFCICCEFSQFNPDRSVETLGIMPLPVISAPGEWLLCETRSKIVIFLPSILCTSRVWNRQTDGVKWSVCDRG